MLPYVLTFLGVALFPLALAAYGGHLATDALRDDPKKRKRALYLVWGLASAGVVAVGLQQVASYDSDKEHDKKQDLLQSKLDSSIRSEENIKGQLQNLAYVFSTLENKPPSNVDERQFLKTLIGTIAASRQSSATGTVSNRQLWDAALDLSRRLRTYQMQMTDAEQQPYDKYQKAVAALPGHLFQDKDRVAMSEAWNTMISEQGKVSNQWRSNFGSLRSEAINMRTQLLNRLPPQPEDQVAHLVLDIGAIVGPSPVAKLADYIESKARILDLSK